MPVALSQEDKDRFSFVARIGSSVYQIEVKSFLWCAIIWADSSVPATVWIIDEQEVARGIPSYINPQALWYPGVTLTYIEGGIVYETQVAYDYDSERPVYSNGPYTPVKWGQQPIIITLPSSK